MAKKRKNAKRELKAYVSKKISKLSRTEKLMYSDSFFGTDTATAAIKNRFNSTFLIPFALALGAPATFIAMLDSVPLLVGSFFQLFVADLMKLIKSRKEIILFTSLLDAFLWIPIMLIPFLWNNDYVLLLNIVILQAVSLSLLRPFYNSLIGDLLPTGRRGKVLGSINLISSGASFFGNLLFGFIINAFDGINVFIGFAVIFSIQFVSRTLSSLLRARYPDKPLKMSRKMQSLLNFSRNLKHSNFGIFVLYSSLIQFALAISGPFFTPYMLNVLGWDMLTYSFVISASIISSLLVLKAWGEHIDRKGSRWMLSISGFLIPIMPIFWILFKHPVVLILVQFFSGAAWAAYTLSASTFILDATDRKSRLIMTSYYHFFIGIFVFVGAMIGGILIDSLPPGFMGSSYYFVFLLSAVLRLVFSMYFIPKIRDERYVNIKIRGKEDDVFIMPHRGFFQFDPKKRK